METDTTTPHTIPLYVGIARAIQWHQRTNEDFKRQAANRIKAYEEILPSGSGIDIGTSIDTTNSTPEKIILLTAFHHMNEGGGYDGWTQHEIRITPSLQHGFNLKVTGRDRNNIKEYLGDLYADILNEEAPEYSEHEGHDNTTRPCRQCQEA